MSKRRTLLITFILVFTILALTIFTGCKGVDPAAPGESGGHETGQAGDSNAGKDMPESALTGSTEDILQLLLEEDVTYFIDPVTPENAPSMLGMTPDDFVSFVEEATTAMNILGMIAFQATVVKLKDINDADTIAEMMQTGFDSSKWIETMPERSLTVISGRYILLAVGTADQTDSLAAAFKDAAGGVASEPVIFYSGEFGVDVDSEFGIEPLPAKSGSEG